MNGGVFALRAIQEIGFVSFQVFRSVRRSITREPDQFSSCGVTSSHSEATIGHKRIEFVLFPSFRVALEVCHLFSFVFVLLNHEDSIPEPLGLCKRNRGNRRRKTPNIANFPVISCCQPGLCNCCKRTMKLLDRVPIMI